MTLVLQVIATVAAGLFAGAALYINLVEHPKRVVREIRRTIDL